MAMIRAAAVSLHVLSLVEVFNLVSSKQQIPSHFVCFRTSFFPPPTFSFIERCRDPPSDTAGRTCGAIPTILTKNIRMDDVTLHWDLWDTSVASEQQTTCSSSAASLGRSQQSSRGSSPDHRLSASEPAESSTKV
ncbi:unnamed protein product [Dibothriocephalus latus]|uniref:Secreted protein n=1 Tax=Dibothriocephalus latus TaxID=60516 RepID=A0A3P6QLJ8_DIBLA|nr:unnamed protein product [Dibothriocephalus latus]